MIIYKNKDKFNLNDEDINKVLKIIKNYNPNIKFRLEKSPNKYSKSYYLRIYLNNINTSLRISDHDTYYTAQGGGISNLIVGKSTKILTVCNKIQQEIYGVYHKEKSIRIKNIFKEIENNNFTL